MAVSGLIGCSEKFRDVLTEINMVAPVDCSVFGSRGSTGQEMMAAPNTISARANQTLS
jgi:transcriptional regulator with GAF, ATPase, and Fis domain